MTSRMTRDEARGASDFVIDVLLVIPSAAIASMLLGVKVGIALCAGGVLAMLVVQGGDDRRN